MEETINQIVQLRTERAAELADLETQITALMDLYATKAEPYNEKIAELEECCKADVRAFGKSFKNDSVKITYHSPCTVMIWDTERLKELCKRYPKLAEFKKPSDRKEFFKFEYQGE